MPEFLLFASDATLAAIWAGVLLLLALAAMIAERRRMRRRAIDSVGCMPWTAIFLVAAFAAATLLTMALKGWAAG